MPAPQQNLNIMPPRVTEFVEMRLYPLYNSTPLNRFEETKKELKSIFCQDLLSNQREVNQMCQVIINVTTNFKDTFNISPSEIYAYLFKFILENELLSNPAIVNGFLEATNQALKRIENGCLSCPISERAGKELSNEITRLSLSKLRKEIIEGLERSRTNTRGEELIMKYRECSVAGDPSSKADELFGGRWEEQNRFSENLKNIQVLISQVSKLADNWN